MTECILIALAVVTVMKRTRHSTKRQQAEFDMLNNCNDAKLGHVLCVQCKDHMVHVCSKPFTGSTADRELCKWRMPGRRWHRLVWD